MNKVKLEIIIGYEGTSQRNKAMSMVQYLRIKTQDYAKTWGLPNETKIRNMKDHTAV